jgi:plasmid maintenance system antidote protein VapI
MENPIIAKTIIAKTKTEINNLIIETAEIKNELFELNKTYFNLGEIINLNTSRLSEIISHSKQLSDITAQIQNEILKLNKTHLNLENKINFKTSRLREILSRSTHMHEIMRFEKIFTDVAEYALNIPEYEILQYDELVLIVRVMDKTDFTQRCNCPRWFEFEKLVKSVIKFKKLKLLTGLTLEKIKKTGWHNSLPPINYYDFTFSTGAFSAQYGRCITFNE